MVGMHTCTHACRHKYTHTHALTHGALVWQSLTFALDQRFAPCAQPSSQTWEAISPLQSCESVGTHVLLNFRQSAPKPQPLRSSIGQNQDFQTRRTGIALEFVFPKLLRAGRQEGFTQLGRSKVFVE